MNSTCPHDTNPAAVIIVDTHPDSPWHGSISINRGYSGAHEFDRRTGYACPTPTWRTEFVPGNTKANAQRIVDAADKVTAKLAELGVRHARLDFEFDGDAIVVTEYDGRSFTFTV